MYIYVYVCIYVYIYVYICIYMYIYVYICIFIFQVLLNNLWPYLAVPRCRGLDPPESAAKWVRDTWLGEKSRSVTGESHRPGSSSQKALPSSPSNSQQVPFDDADDYYYCHYGCYCYSYIMLYTYIYTYIHTYIYISRYIDTSYSLPARWSLDFNKTSRDTLTLARSSLSHPPHAALQLSGPRQTTMPDKMLDRMLEKMWTWMSERDIDRMSECIYQNICRIDCQNVRQNLCQIE